MGAPADVDERVGERQAHRLGLRPRARKQPAPGRGREWHGDLELGIVAPAGALIGFRPAVVENVFAAGMGFHVAGDGADEGTGGVLGEQVHRLPADACPDRLRQFKRGEEIMGNEWVIWYS